MLSIGKFGAGGAAYYLQKVASGIEDYYLYSGEAPGRWIGKGCAAVGLEGAVDAESLSAVLQRTDPKSGERLCGHTTVPGFDLTFSAPKSVSVLFALGDADLSARVRDAHDRAVEQAVRYLEREAGHGRRGHGGLERVRTSGFVAASFRHRTSRAGDPQLHSHVVLANAVRGEDGRWSALDGRSLYAHGKTAGTLYQAAMRDQLRDLGLEWRLLPNGTAEVSGIPRAVLREFSQRRLEIEQRMAERVESGARAAQTAALDTRKAKEYGVEPASLAYEWLVRAERHGWTRDSVNRLEGEGRTRLAEGRTETQAVQVDRAVVHACSPQGLTHNSSTFDRRAALRGLAGALPDGATVAQIERTADTLLAGELAVRLSAARYTTPELLDAERRLCESAVGRQWSGCAVASADAVETALARRAYLGDEQVHMVRTLCTSGSGVDAVNALAGSGKTTALGAAVEAWQASGHHVVGATLSARAAGILRDETAMSTFTIAQLQYWLRHPEFPGLAPGTVLVLDEAGQIGTRALAEIHERIAGVDAKLVLVGDTHQLPEIEAGGAFHGLVQLLPSIELTTNHRQRDLDEQARLRELRHGDVATAMRSYTDAGLVHGLQSSEETRQQCAADFVEAFLSGSGPASPSWGDACGMMAMIALTNQDVTDLNQRARRLLIEAGAVSGPSLAFSDGREFAAGDCVVTRHTDRSLGVANGERWTVAEPHEGSGALRLEPVGACGDREGLTLPAEYVEQHLRHAYAVTTAIAQGSTLDQAYVLGSELTYREAGYVAASRARQHTAWYVVSREPVGLECADGERGPAADSWSMERDPVTDLVGALNRSQAQLMARDLALPVAPGGLDTEL